MAKAGLHNAVNIKNVSNVKDILTELIADIEAFLEKAEIGIKGKIGSPVVRQFLREVKGKVKNMMKDIKETDLREAAEKIVAKIEESDKDGSFEDIRSKVQAAIRTSTYFPEKDNTNGYIDSSYIRDMFEDKCVVSYNGKYYELGYAIVDNVIVLTAPKEVKEIYVPVMESAAVDIKEAKFQITKAGKEEDLVVTDFISLKEAKFNSDFSEVEVTLVEAGTNIQKKRHYPVKTIQESAGIFKGWKMYINHPTPSEEKERPERNLRDWASTIVESRYENGKAIGVVAIHDTWLRERLADPVAREHIGLSINTGGKISIGRVNGQEMQIVEAIISKRKNGPPSVDWVTEAGARGKVNQLLESRFGGRKMELEQATIANLKESRTDLVEAIRKEADAGNVEKVAKLEKDLKEAQGKIEAFDKGQKLTAQVAAVEVALKEAKIPEASKDRIKESFGTTLVEGDLKESITKAIGKELEYVNKLSGNGKIKIGSSSETPLKESLGAELDSRAGIVKEPEKK